MAIEHRDYQEHAVDEARLKLARLRKLGEPETLVISGPTGSGKCHPAGTPIMLFDGSVVPVEHIQPGMTLMGPDNQRRTVQTISHGYGPIVEVVPTKGESWFCNDEHVLTLVKTRAGHKPSEMGGEVVDVPVNEWRTWSATQRHIHKLMRVGVDFDAKQQPVHPYLLGVLLGDGGLTQGQILLTSADRGVLDSVAWLAVAHGVEMKALQARYMYSLVTPRGHANPLLDSLRGMGLIGLSSGDKFIPHEYKTGNRAQRLELLAGLIDTDGAKSGGGYDYVSKSYRLAADIAFVARSLGLAAYLVKKMVPYEGKLLPYWRVSISGDCSVVPVRIGRKRTAPRQQKKDVLRTGFTVHDDGDGHYYGFTLDGDGHYLLGDFTVTHNTVVGGKIIKGAQAKGSPVAFIADRRELVKQTSERLYEAGIPHGVIMAGSTYGSSHLVQVCSAQTLEKRGFRHFKLVLVDECHTVRQATVRIIKDWGITAIGLTATPFTEGLGKIYKDVVNVSTTNQLIEDGWLVPLRVFSATQIDMTGEKPAAGGDWTDEQVERKAMPVIGDVVAEWIAGTHRVFGGPVKTLVFTSTVATGLELARKFNEAGYRFEQVSYKSTEGGAQPAYRGVPARRAGRPYLV